MRRAVFCLALGCALICGCASRESLRSGPRQAIAAYARVAHPDTNVVRLETALRGFAPRGKGGPTLWLASVIHVGEPGYYGALQSHFATQRRVLFEGVSADGQMQPVAALPDETSKRGQREHEPLQVRVAKSLELVFQLEAIDYSPSNMVN